jgi:hypothetical protein
LGLGGAMCKSNAKTKELQANNPDVDYVFISMDKADKWKTGMENMRYPEITIWLTIKWKVYLHK